MNYFGTDLDRAGHYFWILEGNEIKKSDVLWEGIPFNPEEPRLNNGEVLFDKIEGYSILRIGGSCYDKRPQSKSVFFLKEDLMMEQMIEKIRNIPIAQKIINQMPFEVNYLQH